MDQNVLEKIGILTAKAEAAHYRIDKLETGIRDDLKSIQADLKELNANMHRGKGWAAAMMLLAGTGGAGILKLFTIIGK